MCEYRYSILDDARGSREARKFQCARLLIERSGFEPCLGIVTELYSWAEKGETLYRDDII